MLLIKIFEAEQSFGILMCLGKLDVVGDLKVAIRSTRRAPNSCTDKGVFVFSFYITSKRNLDIRPSYLKLAA